MGVPYSKQIHLAFEQVSPLVEAGFKVLQTTKNITFLLAAIQVLTTILLGLILVAIVGLIITVSPDLEHERQVLVTPAVRWLAESAVQYISWLRVGVWTIIIGIWIGAAASWYVASEVVAESVDVEIEAPEGETAASEEANL